MSQIEHLRKIFKTNADRPCLIEAETGRHFTYGELLDRSKRLATALEKRGLRNGDKILFSASNSIELAMLYFAAWHVGVEVIPINPLLHEHEFGMLAKMAAADLVCVSAEVRAKFDGVWASLTGANIVCFKETGSLNPEEESTLADFNVEDEITRNAPCPGLPFGDDTRDDTVFLRIYTSGTTSLPKGIQMTWGGVLGNERLFGAWHGVTPNSRFYNILPMAYLGGIHNLLMLPLACGGSVVIDRPFGTTNIFRFWDTVRELKINTLWFTAAHLAMLLSLRDDEDMGWLRSQIVLGLVGMAPLAVRIKREFEERFGFMLYENYALSETTFLTSNRNSLVYKPGSSGPVLPGVELKIVDDSGADLRVGHDGTIKVRTPYMMKGYVDAHETDRSSMQDGWFITGDIGHLDQDGELFVTGRAKDLIIRGGLNISPATVEAALYTHEAVQEAAVVGIPHDVYGEEIVGVVTLKPGQNASSDGLLAHCAERLANFQRPRSIHILDEMPKGVSGKIEKRQIRAKLAILTDQPRV